MTELSVELIEIALCEAYKEALKAYKADEVPVGSVILHNNIIIAKTRNRIVEKKDPTAHAEILAIKKAAEFLNNERLNECFLFTTLEPCTMCSGAIILSRIKSVYYLAEERKAPSLKEILKKKTYNHYPKIYYYPMTKYNSSQLLSQFFAKKRNNSISLKSL